MSVLMSDVLLSEYGSLITELGDNAKDSQIIASLIETHDWTEKGATAILSLARSYGTAILRNALALAEAMNIEDGSEGL